MNLESFCSPVFNYQFYFKNSLKYIITKYIRGLKTIIIQNMKKLLLFISVVGIGCLSTFCKKESTTPIQEEIEKERTCKCIDNNTTNSVSYTLVKGKLADQKQECERKTTNIYTCSLDLL